MRSFRAFFNKEFLEQMRSGKLTVIVILFVLFGIMNPAIAKLTPWLLELFADTLAESGMTVAQTAVDALDAWVQFFKNAPMALIAFVLLQSSVFTKEYAAGTLVLSVTKGLERFKIVLAKETVLVILWSAGYWLQFGITYAYSAYYWDNAVAQDLALSVTCWWLFGVFVLSLVTLFSTVFRASASVLLGTCGVVLLCSLVGLVPRVGKYLPTMLTDGTSLLTGASDAQAYLPAVLITAFLSILCFAVSIPVFDKKQL